MSPTAAATNFRARSIATHDPRSIRAGVVAALGFHLALLVLLGWATIAQWLWRLLALIVCSISPNRVICFSHPMVAAPPAPVHEEEIIEGALLRQGGGGEYDPRRMLHRQVPIRTEIRPSAASDLGRQHAHPEDAGTRVDPTALVTQRDILGHGNQDLAERLQRLAESEQEASPTAAVGPGSPDGSVNGTETDPNRAGHGAQAKIRSFLQRQLHLLATAPLSAHRAFRLRIFISSDGAYIARGQVVQGSGDDTTDADLAVQLAQLGENQTPIPELTAEEKAAIAGHVYAVRYVPN